MHLIRWPWKHTHTNISITHHTWLIILSQILCAGPNAGPGSQQPGAPRRRAPTAAEEADLDLALASSRTTVTATNLSVPTSRSARKGASASATADAGKVTLVHSHLFDAPAARKAAATPLGQSAPSAGPSVPAFKPSATFTGALVGYAFKQGSLGVGYYPDAASGTGAAAGPGPGSAALAAAKVHNPATHQKAPQAPPQAAPAAAAAGAKKGGAAGKASGVRVAAAVAGGRADDGSHDDEDVVQDAEGRQAQLVRMAFAGVESGLRTLCQCVCGFGGLVGRARDRRACKEFYGHCTT